MVWFSISPPVLQDPRAAAMMGVCRGEVAVAPVVTVVGAVIDEGVDLPLEVSWQEVMLKQYPVLQGLMPSILPCVRRSPCAERIHDPACVVVVGQVARDPMREVEDALLHKCEMDRFGLQHRLCLQIPVEIIKYKQ
jgi:hypothetical protein